MREMIRRVSRWSVIAAPLFIVMVCGMAWGGVNPVKIGVLAKRGPELCMEKWAPTAEYLTARIPGKTFVIVPLDFDKICSFVEKGKVDFILANPAFYVELESRYGADRIATLKNLRLGAGYTQFGGVVFSRADRTDLTGLRDLKNIAFIAADPRAFGAWIAVLRELKENGIDPLGYLHSWSSQGLSTSRNCSDYRYRVYPYTRLDKHSWNRSWDDHLHGYTANSWHFYLLL